MRDFERAIGDLDLGLFSRIESQSSDHDKSSFLAVQKAVRELCGSYRYLEIGSHLGGSIQPHLLDAKCSRIFSIDKRPEKQPDARGIDYRYDNNSTERMMSYLREVDSSATAKITTIDGGTDEISPTVISESIQLCLIDGEHTDAAMKRDFEFCRKVVDPAGAAIMFHDAQITYQGIYEVIEELKQEGVRFNAYNLPDVLFVVELGDFQIHKNPAIMEHLVNNYQGYLYSLRDNDKYRRFANRAPFKVARNFYAKLLNGNIS